MATAQVTTANDAHSDVLLASPVDMMRIFFAGMSVGVLSFIIFLLLKHYVFMPMLCGNEVLGNLRCQNVDNLANGFAMVLGAIGGLVALVQLRVLRPLLVVLCASVGIWNCLLLGAGLVWWQGALAMVLLFGLAYAAFAWLLQLRSFVVALILGLVLVVVLRLVLMA